MYQVLIDGRDLYYPGDEEYSVVDAVAKLQLNDSGTFECGVPVQNPEYKNLKGLEKWKRNLLWGSPGGGKGFLRYKAGLRSR